MDPPAQARADTERGCFVDAGDGDPVTWLGRVHKVIVRKHVDTVGRLALRDSIWILLEHARLPCQCDFL